MRLISLTAGIAVLGLGTGVAFADSVTPFDSTTGTGPFEITSSCTPTCTDGGVAFDFSSAFNFNTLATLSASFTDISSGADAGSPRFEILATNGDFFTVYLGTPPGFTDSDPATFTATYSGTNFNNASTNSQYMYNYPLSTLGALEALYGGDSINEIDFILDSGYAANGAEDLILNGIDVNGTNYTSSLSQTPLPATLPLFAGGLGAITLLMRKKRRAAKSAI